ncbi:hypothetical protein WR25_02341 [Diploscapter pachys]|uniref:Uncharacterized protein n=1 Tax=Diploscapter pachys TaxID=2018661 RepID=A0A2A2K0Z3_9BILA|nr:hypothetical protein WR25_02341 [Diploscapter pachys]
MFNFRLLVLLSLMTLAWAAIEGWYEVQNPWTSGVNPWLPSPQNPYPFSDPYFKPNWVGNGVGSLCLFGCNNRG